MSLWLFPTMIVIIDLIIDTTRILPDDTRVMVTLMVVKFVITQVQLDGLLREGLTVQDHFLLKAGISFIVTSVAAINSMNRKKKKKTPPLTRRRTTIGFRHHHLPLNIFREACDGK